MKNHEYVDLGLPSGTLWATCNVGASKPEECGDYFAWGETTPKENYWWDTYKWCKGSEKTQTKYCVAKDYGTVDGLTQLESADDAATANWGEEWRMPTREELEELLVKCDWEDICYDGSDVKGLLLTSRANGNSIFMPYTGMYTDKQDVYNGGISFLYWSATLTEEEGLYEEELKAVSHCAYSFQFDLYDLIVAESFRAVGLCVRPVRKEHAKQKTNRTIDSFVADLNKSIPQESKYLVSSLNADGCTLSLYYNGIAVSGVRGCVNDVYAKEADLKLKAQQASRIYEEILSQYDNLQPGKHELVDLGLPSGTKWANCNIGAGSPFEYGDFYRWGELEPLTESSPEYVQEDLGDTLPADHDVATCKWGPEYRVPSQEDFKELLKYCMVSKVDNFKGTGVDGQLVVSLVNGKSIFFPATGEFYWTSTFDLSMHRVSCYLEWRTILAHPACGNNVRPVGKPEQAAEVEDLPF